MSSFFRELRFYIAKLDGPAMCESLTAKLMAAIYDVHRREQKANVDYYRVIGAQNTA